MDPDELTVHPGLFNSDPFGSELKRSRLMQILLRKRAGCLQNFAFARPQQQVLRAEANYRSFQFL